MKRAVFLDRDGVLNRPVLNPATGLYEPPHSPEKVIFFPGVVESLLRLTDAGFVLFLVSNQPDYAKGKATLESIRAVHARFDHILTSNGVHFQEYYYCHHHPEGIVPEYSGTCRCRKPSPYFLVMAASDHRICLERSWMVGDRDTDIECGKAAGTRTILIEEPQSSGSRGTSKPDYRAANLKDAVTIILDN